MRTQGAFYADSPHGGGFVFYGAGQLATSAAATVFPWTRNAAGDVSLNGPTPAAAGTTYFWLSISNIKRLVETSGYRPFQQQFGTAAATPGWPAGAPGVPPFLDTSQLVPALTDAPKGIQVTDIFAVYSVQTAALGSATLAMYRTVYTDQTALQVTTVVAPATINAATTPAANAPNVDTVAVSAPVFETTDDSNLLIELALTTAATSVVRVYGMGAHLRFNFN